MPGSKKVGLGASFGLTITNRTNKAIEIQIAPMTHVFDNRSSAAIKGRTR